MLLEELQDNRFQINIQNYSPDGRIMSVLLECLLLTTFEWSVFFSVFKWFHLMSKKGSGAQAP